ncbi:sugar nucleotidyltransferase [Halosimplex rubrum]|uniref:Sugar nucleotidyltransferase n=1 Tax=Halosimplex rubrum TaxID=869889 RepID=A0A7D5T6D3_9EURY|nr:sugar phosphate nucleotidyltransferase [Halosimplex rubrum]QLH77635.1 sugar nucleotidyltransferase [Halosimplex rubrum]
MKAVIPAAGRGTRLRPHTEDRPKPLVPVGDRPLLSHGLDELAALGVTEFVIVVGHRKEAIIDRYGDAFDGVPITYVHQREPKGLADAVLRAETEIDEDFLVFNADNVMTGNLGEVVERQRTDGVDATLLVDDVSRDEAADTGVFVTDDDGRLDAVVEKPSNPPSTQVLTGLFGFSPDIFHACHLVQPSDRGEYELTDAIDLFLRAERRVETVAFAGQRVNVNTPADRERAERLVEE